MNESPPQQRLSLCLGIVTCAALAAPSLALAETPPATVSGLPVEPCLASASLPVGNPLPCPAPPSGAQPAGAQSASTGAGGAAGAAGPAGAGAGASVQANTTNTKVKAKVKKRARRHVTR